MANDNDSVDSNGNSTDLRPRRSNRAKGKPIQQSEETDENVVVHNNVVYKVGDFVYYLDKKQDIYRIGLIEEFKHQKRDKLVNKRPEISVKQFYRLDEIPSTVLSNQGEYDTHVMPPNFPEWLRQREIFISDNALSTSCSSLRSLCTVRHFPDLNHAMALFSTAQSSGQVTNSSPRVDILSHNSIITGKDNSCIPIPKQRDDNTFFYVYSYNARGRKLAATYLEIRVGPAYQVELPELQGLEDQLTDPRYKKEAWEQILWKPNKIPEEVFNVYIMATVSIACFSGFGGGVDDSASVENGRKIASHMLTCQKALDCLHKSQYNMEKAMESFAENSLPETSKMPFLWTDEDHVLFDESVKIHGKNFLRIKQDKRNKKGRLVGDYVTFYYYWKKNRPKNRKYATKKNLRSRASIAPSSEQDASGLVKIEATVTSAEDLDKTGEADNQSPSDTSVECCLNCKAPLPKPEEEEVASENDKTLLSDRMRILCAKCQHYLRRYGYQKPPEIADKIKASDDDDEINDFEEGVNGFDEEEDDDEAEGEEEDEDEVFHANSSPQNATELEDSSNKNSNQSVTTSGLDSKTTLAINKYDFDEEDENVEEVSSLLKKNHAKQHLLRESEPKTIGYKLQNNGSGYYANKIITSFTNKPFNKTATLSTTASVTCNNSQTVKTPVKPSEPLPKSNKRSSLLKKSSNDSCKRRKLEAGDDTAVSRALSVTSRNSVTKQIHESLKSSLSHTPKLDGKKPGLLGQNEITSSQYDSNSTTSSSSSTSNDSSSSGDEADTLPLVKRAAAHLKFPGVKFEATKELKVDTTNKSTADNSYNQMITCIPNIPGVCAVTNVGEPMPQLMQNLTDLSAPQSSFVSDLNITVAEPLYKQLSLRNSVTTASAASFSSTSSESVASANKLQSTLPAANPEPIAKFVNFNAISNPRTEGNPEETGLNLVKPKKRTDSSFGEHNWAPPHDSPSKLVHHRGDNFVGETSAIENAPKQMINDNEVVHESIFGHIVRVLKSGDGCARTDLQHTTSSLKSSDLDKKRSYISKHKMTDSVATVSTVQLAGSQDSAKKLEEAKKPGEMLPPTDKNLVHHQSTSKHYNLPALTHSSSSSISNQPSQSIPGQMHGRKVNSSHGLRSQSPASNRPQSSFPSISSNMIRPNHMHNTNLHNLSNPANSVRPNMHMNPNNSLLADYNNMNKVNMNELLFYQPPPTQSYEQQELMKLFMMYNPAAMQQHIRPMQWDQRDRFGSNSDAWGGGMPVPMGLGGAPPMGQDLQSILRAINQTQVGSGGHSRPRSATGLNLSSATNPGAMAGGSGPPGHNGDKPGSGRASVNHEFPRPDQMTENPEVLETLRILMADQMYQNLLGMQKPVPPQAAMHPQQQQQANPPVAHALNNFAVGAFPGGQHMAMPHALLSQMAAQAPASKQPSFVANNAAMQRQSLQDLFSMYLGYNPPR